MNARLNAAHAWLNSIQPTLPLTVEDAQVVHTRVKALLPDLLVDVYFVPSEIRVTVYEGWRRILDRRLLPFAP